MDTLHRNEANLMFFYDSRNLFCVFLTSTLKNIFLNKFSFKFFVKPEKTISTEDKLKKPAQNKTERETTRSVDDEEEIAL